jgi:hypothetical protein
MERVVISLLLVAMISLAGCLGGSDSASKDILGEDLIAHFKLDEIEGDLEDSTGISGPASPSYDPIYGVEGKIGTALRFDGNKDYLNLKMTFSGMPGKGASVCMWLQWNNPGEDRESAVWGSSDEGGYDMWRIAILNQKVAVTFNSISEKVTIRTESTVEDGEWHHICSIYDVESEYIHIYFDGVREDSRSAPLVGGFVQTKSHFLGCSNSLGKGCNHFLNFQGLIDDVRIYNASLTESLITELALG